MIKILLKEASESKGFKVTLIFCIIYSLLVFATGLIASGFNKDHPQAKPTTTLNAKVKAQIHLTNQGDCADVILATVCHGNDCQDHVSTIFVVCEDVAEETLPEDLDSKPKPQVL